MTEDIFSLTNGVSDKDFENTIDYAIYADIDISKQKTVKPGRTLLHEAILEKNEHRAKILIKNGANVNTPDWGADTPLHEAVSNDLEEIAELLLINGADANAEEADENTPLHDAVYGKQENMAKLLVKFGADINKENDSANTPLSIAARYGQEWVKMLTEQFAKSTEPKTIFEAIDNMKNLKKLDEILGKIQEKLDGSHDLKKHSKFWHWINQVDKDKQTALYNAIDAGNEPLAEVLAKYTSGRYEKPELNIAVEKHFKKVAELLLNNGAYIQSKDYRGITPFIYAVKNKSKEMVELLLKNGASEYNKDEHGDMVIHIALKNKSKEIVELLMKKSLLKYAKNDAGETPESIAKKMDEENIAANRKPEWLELIIGKEEFERRERERRVKEEKEQRKKQYERVEREQDEIADREERERNERKEQERQEIEQWKMEREEREHKNKTNNSFRESQTQANIDKCTDNLVTNNTNISLRNAINLCSTMNGVLDTPDERKIPEKFDKVLHKWFLENGILEEIFKMLHSKHLCFIHSILYIEDDKTFNVTVHQGRKERKDLPFDFSEYYENEIKNCKSKLIAIPVNIQSYREIWGHATILIIDRTGEIDHETGKERIIAEYFDSAYITYYEIKGFERELLKFITTLFGDKYTYDFIGQKKTCPNAIQGRLAYTDYEGSCSQFQLWYAFKRLLEPEKSRKTVIEDMNRLLDQGVPGIIKLIKSFQSLLNIRLYDYGDNKFSGKVNGRKFVFAPYEFDGGKKRTKRRGKSKLTGRSKLTSRSKLTGRKLTSRSKLTSRKLAQRKSARKR
jgi:ankyrin repeat protein